MLERIRGVETLDLTGGQIRTIGAGLYYKRLDLILGGKGQGEPNSYDSVRARILEQTPEQDWQPENIYPISLTRRDRRLTCRALEFAESNPGRIADHNVMQADAPRLDDPKDWGLGISDANAPEVCDEQRRYANELALAATATRQVIKNWQPQPLPHIVPA